MSTHARDDCTSAGLAPEYLAHGAQVLARCNTLGRSQFSDTPGCLYRPFLGKGHRATLDQTAEWFRSAGMSVKLDGIGNLVGRYEGQDPGAPAILIGSHVDSVRNAGFYDGPLGVMLGLELVSRLFEAGRRLPCAIEVIAFGDEEGSRFPESMLCSRAVTGSVKPGDLQLSDSSGTSLSDALSAFPPLDDTGLSVETVASAARSADEILCFVEPHIEQGPLLESIEEAIGVVTAIAGQQRYRFAFTGQAGHAGTTSMRLRKDALAASAEAIQLIESVAAQYDEDVVATVGQLNASPGAVNVIPGRVDFTLDVRSGSDQLRIEAAKAIVRGLSDISERRGIEFEYELLQDLEPTPCDPKLVDLMTRSVQSVGGSGRHMVSGAGHDTMVMAHFVPSILLFIRCLKGISHHPSESVEAVDIAYALAALEDFVVNFASDSCEAG